MWLFYDVELQGTSMPDDIFSIMKLVSSDCCDSKPGKIKKTVTIMASTSRASRKTVEDAEMCVLWTLSSYTTWQIIPPSTAHGNRQVTFRWNLVRQLIGTFTSRKRTGRKRSLTIGTASPHLFRTLQKISGRVKVCALCSEKKKKKLHQEGVKRQNINVSSVIFPCAVCGVFWNTTSSEMWRCKISWVGYYMHTFITNKLKKELSFCLF